VRVEELTFFRFVAASIVVIFHYGKEATGFSGVLVAGPEMVTFFFVLSGFVMGISYIGRDIKASSYWWARVSRILPVYFLALALVAFGKLIVGNSIDKTSLVLSITLLQSWFPPYPTSINAPAWSLSVEAFFYLSFPLILFLVNKHNPPVKYMIIISLSIWAITQTITTTVLSNEQYHAGNTLSHDLIYYFPLTHICSFLLGVSGSMLFKIGTPFQLNDKLALLFVGLSLLLIVLFGNNEANITGYTGLHFAYGSSFYSPIFLVFIISIATCRSKIINLLSAPLLVVLGEASYSLYILQKPIHAIYDRYIASTFMLQPLEDFILFYLLLILISIVTFKLFERPVNMYLRYSLPQSLKHN
jgi:peptidoglycan/LPS O-acetylase OafA/YrhL